MMDVHSRHALPRGWSEPEWFSEQAALGDFTLQLAGVAARAPSGELIAGSAAGTGGLPALRAFYELLERASVWVAMNGGRDQFAVREASGRLAGTISREQAFPSAPSGSDWTYARSNGVALHGTWSEACTRAHLELAERDRVLRAWFGQIVPERVSLPELSAPEDLYAFEAWRFGFGDPEVAGVFAFPRAAGPLAYGFCAARNIDLAVEGAASECLQRLGFLWGEPIPDREPAPSASPSFHQDYFLYPPQQARLRAWLAGAHAGACVLPPSGPSSALFIDLTAEGLDGLFVAKALPSSELPLTFGVGHPILGTAVPAELSVHPIA